MTTTRRLATALGTSALAAGLVTGLTAGAADAATTLDRVVIHDPAGPTPTCNVTRVAGKLVRDHGRTWLVVRAKYAKLPRNNVLAVLGRGPGNVIDWEVSWSNVGTRSLDHMIEVSAHGYGHDFLMRGARVHRRAHLVTFRVRWSRLHADTPRHAEFYETDATGCYDDGTSRGLLG